jgi:hypothetical protein
MNFQDQISSFRICFLIYIIQLYIEAHFFFPFDFMAGLPRALFAAHVTEVVPAAAAKYKDNVLKSS